HSVQKITERLIPLLQSFYQKKKIILQKVDDNFLEVDIKPYDQVFRSTSFIGKFFNRDYTRSKQELSKFSKIKIRHNQWIELFNHKLEYDRYLGEIKQLCSENEEEFIYFKDYFNLVHIEQIKKKLEHLDSIVSQIEKFDKKRTFNILHFLLNNGTQFTSKFNKGLLSFNSVNDFFESPILQFKGKINDKWEIIDKLNSEFHSATMVSEFKTHLIKLPVEVQNFIKKYAKIGSKDILQDVFLKTYYSRLLDLLYDKKYIPIPKFQVNKYRSEVFTARDKLRIQIMKVIEDQQPVHNYSSGSGSEVALLKRENEKKRRLLPVRDLLERISSLVFTLKPCFMMSPLTVSQYINPDKIEFDVVIFDEASQIMPQDAIPCLIRAKQAIIMGDTQQLPPTSFFLSTEDDDNIDDSIIDLDSFLSEASTKFRELRLNWHYRSMNENLINYSNRNFYNNSLITFPNKNSLDNSGIEFIHVPDGVYDRGKSKKNIKEAERITYLYEEIKQEYPDSSIGIIAFSTAQEKAIREAFENRGIDIEESIDPHTEELFIKNLETVQGDERDIIILSIGYGKDSDGKLSYQFGPIIKEGGYKRLNVAITRSRFKTYVVSSIDPSELDASRIKNEGASHLRKYLHYAKYKERSNIDAVTPLGFESAFEESVFYALTSQGHELESQVGCSNYRIDLAIKHPNKPGEFILGIECDGAQYHSSRYARDRDNIRQKVLENRGWKLLRIWSEDWLNNREYEIKRINEKVEELLDSDEKALSNLADEKFTEIEDIEDFKECSLKDNFESYYLTDLDPYSVEFTYDKYGYLKDFRTIGIITIQIKKILLNESPIEKGFLFRRILQSFDIKRVGKRLEYALDRILVKMEKNNQLYLYGNTVSNFRINIITVPRISTEDIRPFDSIPKEEIGGAVIEILKNSFSTPKEAIAFEIVREFYGLNRAGSKIKTKVASVLLYLKEHDLIEEVNEMIVLKDKL
ncbi:MAG: AAA domain-containing protein, partial [Promethearchaeota archaeon]